MKMKHVHEFFEYNSSNTNLLCVYQYLVFTKSVDSKFRAF